MTYSGSRRVHVSEASPPGLGTGCHVRDHQGRIGLSSDATLTSDGKMLEVLMRSPEGATLNVAPANPPQPFDAANPGTNHLTFEATLALGASKVIVVDFLPNGTSTNEPATAVTGLKDW